MNVTIDIDHVTNVTDTRLIQFYKNYAGVHGYVSVCVCLFGFVTNIFNVTGNIVCQCSHLYYKISK